MRDVKEYDALVIVTPKDYLRLRNNYEHLSKKLPVRKIIYIGSDEVGQYVKEDGIENITFMNENDIIPFDDVYKVISKAMADLLCGRELPRGICGWYYQQFLKLEYARICSDEYYMVWDGDTIPCDTFSMFDDNGIPYLDTKHEYHEEYFVTLEKILPGIRKVIGKSFIAEHMLFRCDLVKEMLEETEKNGQYNGGPFWEKIVNSISPELLQRNSFSEFETYGSYVAIKHTNEYRLRSWNSFRYGGYFFNPDTICDRDFAWLSKDFFAISFEKRHSVRDDFKNLFDNEEYQKKLSARKMLEIAQEEFQDGYIEVWD